MYGRGWRDVCLCQGEYVLVFAMLHLCIFIRGVCVCLYVIVWWMGREKVRWEPRTINHLQWGEIRGYGNHVSVD